jgi:N-acetylmuramoyl-L-alanine amidase
MTKLIPAIAAFIVLLAVPLRAQDLSALTRFDPAASAMVATDGTIEIALAIGQPVPWRLRVLDEPPRLILDVREVDWTGIDRLPRIAPVVALRAGTFRPGWSRLVMELDGPHRVAQSEMVTAEGDGAVIRLTMAQTDPQDFAAAAALPDLPEWAVPESASFAPLVKVGSGATVVVLDPGHGGLDPGAESEGLTEAALMLTFARELKELLIRDGRFSVVMTREEDVFVPLETRISIAREAGASLFISLHADALAEGEAQGATVYTLSEDASDEATAALAERHDRDDLLAGIDLTDQDDLVAAVLMDMARTETSPRTERLADAIVAAIKAAEIRMHRHPRQSGGFSVLKSPDIPSVLLELGFLSSSRDLKRLTDAEWRGTLAEALLQAIATWAKEDAAMKALKSP